MASLKKIQCPRTSAVCESPGYCHVLPTVSGAEARVANLGLATVKIYSLLTREVIEAVADPCAQSRVAALEKLTHDGVPEVVRDFAQLRIHQINVSLAFFRE
jgi:hypothetical protein